MTGDAWRDLAETVRIRQGYVATKDGTTVRVRVVGGEKASVARFVRRMAKVMPEARIRMIG